MKTTAFIISLLAMLFAAPAFALGAVDADIAVDANTAPATNPIQPEVSPEDVGSILTGVIFAVKHAKWAWLVALLLMLCTYLVNRVFVNAIPKKALVWVALGVGVATNVALSLASGLGVIEAIGQGITLGLAAAGGWSAIGRLILPKPKVTH